MFSLLLAAVVPFAVVDNGVAKCRLAKTGVGRVDADIAFFTNAVFRMTGARVPVVDASAAPSGGANRIVFEVEARTLADEDDWSVSFPDAATMKIVGSKMSCRWALNRIVEDWGVVFCQPGPYGTHYPRKKSLSCDRAARKGTAALRLSRDLYIEDPGWLRSLGCKTLGDRNFFGHSLYAVFPLSKYGKEPWVGELMPERKGRRVKPGNAYSGWQPCWASEKGRAEAVKNICAKLRREPGRKVFSLSVNDVEGYCECEKCRELNGGSFSRQSKFGRNYKSHSESYYKWVNAVAEGVQKEFPDVWFGVLAYCGTIDPPSFKLNPHVVPFLCCETYQMLDAKVAADREALFAAWSEKAEAFGLWDYAYGCRAYQAPRMYLKTTADYFALRKKYPKLQAFFMEGDTFVGEGPKRYLYGKLISDPGCDASAELDRWYSACCGEAAASDLKEYYGIWERFFCGKDVRSSIWYRRGLGSVYMDFDQRTYVFAVKEDDVRRAGELVKRICASAERHGDADQKARARDISMWHDLYEARLMSGGAGLTRPDGSFSGPGDAVRFLDRLTSLCTWTRNVKKLTRKVVDARLAKGGDDGRLRHHCSGLLERSRRNVNIIWLLNETAAYRDDPAVRAAIRRAVESPLLDLDIRSALVGLLSVDHAPNLLRPEGLSVEDELKLWKVVDNGVEAADRGVSEFGGRATAFVNAKGGWPAAVRVVPEIDPTCDYLFRARIVNESSATITPRILCSTAYPGTYASMGGNGGVERLVTIKPGESRRVSLFFRPLRLKGRKPAARLYIILNSLPKGSGVVVDSCELNPLVDEKELSADFSTEVGPVRPELHSASYAPTICSQTAQDMKDLKAMGLTYARVHDWALTNPNQPVCDYQNIFPLMKLDPKDPSNYVFAQTDYLLSRARDEVGLKLFYRLGPSIEHSGDKVHFNSLIPRDFDKVAEIFAGIVRHYNRGWANGHKWGIKYWEIWNEPEGIANQWTPEGGIAGLSPEALSATRFECRRKFVRFFVTVLKRLKDEFGDEIKAGGPALCDLNLVWLNELLAACKEAGVAPDFVSWHRYANDPKIGRKDAEVARRVCDSYGFTKCELVMDEWHYFGANYTWGDIQRCEDPKVAARVMEGPDSHNGIRSACYVLSSLADMQTSKLDFASYYGCRHVGHWGFKDSLQRKYKVFYALKLFGEIVRDYSTICRSTSVGTMTTLAVRRTDGRKGLLVVDYGGGIDTKRVQISVEGVAAGAKARARILDHTHNLEPVPEDVRFPMDVWFEDGVLTIAKPDYHSAAFFVEFDEGKKRE